MPKFIDLTGRRFRRLLVVSYAGGPRGKWLCRCDCGTEKPIAGGHLRSGATVSCGCQVPDNCREKNRTHGQSRTPTNISWLMAKNRCFNHRTPRYKDYGGRGVTMCQRWKDSFAAFLADMGPRPIGTTLDRWPNNDGHYEPGNCRWATVTEQNRNRR